MKSKTIAPDRLLVVFFEALKGGRQQLRQGHRSAQQLGKAAGRHIRAALAAEEVRMKQLYIWWLKQRAMKHYRIATTIPEGQDCSLTIAWILYPEMERSRRMFNVLRGKLAQLGEDLPEPRLTSDGPC